MALHPDLFVGERAEMARRYPQFRCNEHLLAAGTLAYAGTITIDAGKGRQEWPTLLVYPEDWPYALPVVYPLEATPADEDWTVEMARRWAVTMPTGYRRHQMPSGNLCLYERDAHGRDPAISGASLLDRAGEVFKAVTLGRPFPFPDSEQAELEAHFLVLGDVILPDVFFDEIAGDRGKFYLFPHNDHSGPALVPQVEPGRLLFVGVNLSVADASGIALGWRNADSPALRRAFPWLSASAFTYEGMTVNAEVRDAAVEGSWFALQQEPPPTRYGRDLAAVLRGVVADPIDELVQLTMKRAWSGARVPVSAPLGLRFPSRSASGRLDWLMLVLDTTISEDERVAVTAEPGVMRDIVRERDVYVLRAHPLVRRDLALRNGRVNAGGLAKKHVLVVGCGALGGDVAVTLAEADVGKLTLVDSDILRTGNAIRHVAPLSAAGMRKVDAVRHMIAEHNPFVEVEVEWGDVGGSIAQLERLLQACDLAISTVADDNVEFFLDETAVRVESTVVYGRAYRRGSAGRVIRVRPGSDACLHCLALYAQDSGTDHGVGDSWIPLSDAEGEVVGRECGNAILAASAVDLGVVARLAAGAVLDELGAGRDWNGLLWTRDGLPEGGPSIERPYSTVLQTFHPHPQCPNCARPRTTRVILSAAARERILADTEAHATVETGGILIGQIDAAGVAHVLEATSAGPNATESATRFERDHDYCQQRLNDAEARLGERGQYLGEWHSHLEADPRPSPLDIESLTGIAFAPNYHTSEPIMLIAGRNPANGRVDQIHASCFPVGQRWYERVLEIESASEQTPQGS